MADIEYSTQAADWLRDAEPDVKEQVMSKLEEASEWPEHFLDALSGVPYYKLRAGDYRAIVDWLREENILFVRRIGHRRNVYDR
jgi:mRNA interferase RelE/StbE